jgi:hypothetical protein
MVRSSLNNGENFIQIIQFILIYRSYDIVYAY